MDRLTVRFVLVAIAAVLAPLALTAGSVAGAAEDRTPRVHGVQVEDDCHPRSFNRAVGPGTCVGGGQTRFAELIDRLEEDGAARNWRFAPERTTITRGDSLRVRSSGGEFHTYTTVARFGGGCVPFLNRILGLRPVRACSDLVTLSDGTRVPRGFVRTAVPPGGRLAVRNLGLGTHRFQCLIHPWMRTTLTVEQP
jgi:plastocyanin